ncbi:MAG: hypothetical protein IPP55_17005 [Anaerolineales bacterium]|nr:hypothetical protein [Anaerolineales bacterium]
MEDPSPLENLEIVWLINESWPNSIEVSGRNVNEAANGTRRGIDEEKIGIRISNRNQTQKQSDVSNKL